MKEQITPNGDGVTAHPPAPDGRVVNVEIGELILDGFGPLNSRPPDSRPPDSRRADSRRADSARAAAALRRELARELADAGAAPREAERLAATIADAVFRQLSAPPREGGAR